jgi:hypothetical protein
MVEIMAPIRRFRWLSSFVIVCAGCGSGADANSSAPDMEVGEIAAAIERVSGDTRCVVP